MLEKKFRATRAQIEEVMKKGNTIQGNFAFAKVSYSSFESPTFTIIVSKKIEKTSVGRHLIKRRVSAGLEKNMKSMGASFNKIMIFFPRKITPVPSSEEFFTDMQNILQKVGFFS